ncbi:MAG: hypothetical protein J6Q32_03700 [Clostridia bacterium]|nr:hypothetical protein [Clostridia bacterium]
MKKLLTFFLICLFVLSGVGCAMSSGEESKQPDLSVSDVTTNLETGLNYYTLEVNGYVTNNTVFDTNTIIIEFTIYDVNGVILGTATDYVNKVRAKQTGRFSCTYMEKISLGKPTRAKLTRLTYR